ncbi:hypothetical protein RUM44_007843 [Polyplax serrata]|uniref:G-protein coupled receptors family 1 profile domain-containing protein n=1 Tax=Polyplax serrata TaxID=468196 RepID=A0ABR1B7A9_POLSC
MVHGYLSLIICIFGSIANVLNIVVLTQKEMKTHTNLILTGLAIADLLVMVEYIPFSYYFYIQPKKYTYNLAVFILFHANFSQVCHTISIWLTVILAVWRNIAIAHPQVNRAWCTNRSTIVAIVATYVICPVICIPLYLVYTLKTSTYKNETIYHVEADTSPSMRDINYWIYGFVIKLLPCILLTFLSFRMVMFLIKNEKRQKLLISSKVKNDKVRSSGKSKMQSNRERQSHRATKMLLVVLLLFLITESPQGILGLLSYSLGDMFYTSCYHPLGDVLDFLALFNSSTNFMIYCTMSRQFRVTFSLLFKPKVLNNWMVTSQVGHLTKNATQLTQV